MTNFDRYGVVAQPQAPQSASGVGGNPFDQFDSPMPSESVQVGNPFDQFDAPASSPPQAPEADRQSFGEWALDQGEFLGSRALNAAASIPGLPADLTNLAAHYLPGAEYMHPALAHEKARMEREGADSMVPFGGENIRAALQDYGLLPKPREPRTDAERYAGAVADFAGGTAVTGAGILNLARGAVARGSAGSTLRSIAAKPGRFAVGEAAAATGAGIGSEAGRDIAPDNPWAPFIGALVGGVSPSILRGVGARTNETARMAVRGGERGRLRIIEALNDFDTAGTTPTVAQASQSLSAQYLEAAMRYAPGAIGRIRNVVERQAQNIGARIRERADALAKNADPLAAGQAVQRGILQGFMPTFRRTSERLYGNVDALIPAQTAVSASRTIGELHQILQPISGAPNISGITANTKLAGMAKALMDDVTAGGGSLPYEGVKQLRAWLGRQLSSSELAPELPRAQLKRIYGALSDDMRSAAVAAGPRAEQAFNRASDYYKAAMRRIEDHLDRLANMGAEPERVFEALWRGREGETFLQQVRRSVPNDDWQAVAAAALRRLGDASDSVQNATGTVWSAETFLTRWNQLSPGAKDAFFGNYGSLRRDLDSIARAAERIRVQGNVLRNSSGTAGAGIVTTTALGTAGAVLTGNAPALAGIGGALLTSNLTARLLTSPRFVRWLSKGVNTEPRHLIPHLGQLSAIASQNLELRDDIAAYLEGISGPTETERQSPRTPQSRVGTR